MAPDLLLWRDQLDNPVPLGLTRPTGHRFEHPDPLAAALVEQAVQPTMTPLIEATRQVVPISPHVLWGNVASALAGAIPAMRQNHSDAAQTARHLVRHLLQQPPLEETGSFEANGTFRRRSCCLFYRLPGGGYCGDCVLVDPSVSSTRVSP
jgi:ferric iron reductase protein FhuF